MTKGRTPRGARLNPVGPPASPGFWLLQAAQRWKVEFARSAAEVDLTHTQFQILAGTGWLEHLDERPTQQDVADQAGIDRMMTSKVIAVLENRGLLTRESKGRRKHVSLTDEGRELTRRATAIAREVDARLFQAVELGEGRSPAFPDAIRLLLEQIARGGPRHDGAPTGSDGGPQT